jgi:hypothetical protein
MMAVPSSMRCDVADLLVESEEDDDNVGFSEYGIQGDTVNNFVTYSIVFLNGSYIMMYENTNLHIGDGQQC